MTEETELSKTETFLKDIRKTSVARSLVAMELMNGWPLPSRKEITGPTGEPETVVFATVPYLGSVKVNGKTGLLPPTMALTARWDNGKIMDVRDFRYERLMANGELVTWRDGVAVFPHDRIAKLKRSEYLKKQQDLYGLYDQLFEVLGTGSELDPGFVSDFADQLGELMDPGLIPFYRGINPAFVDNFCAPVAA